MFEHDRSAARGEMTARGLFVFKHRSALGNAPAHRLFERVAVRRVFEGKQYEPDERGSLDLPPARGPIPITGSLSTPPACRRGSQVMERIP